MYSFKVTKDARKGFLIKDMIENLNSYEAIQEYAKRLGVVIPIDEEKVETILTLGLTEENAVVVQAKPPKNGRDSELKFKVNVSSKATFLPDIDSGNVDYKNAMKHESVSLGDLVAVHLSETEGTPGEDLYGKPIPSIPGNPIRVNIGEGIEREKNLFFATKNGVPRFKNGVLSIDDLLMLDEGVNLKSGNVKSQFSVDVHGDVEEGFEIESEGDVRIFGAFYGKRIKAKGNIEIRHGINGKGKSEIISGGRIVAMFVNQATLKAREEIMVTKNIHHSKLSSLDSIHCQGAIIGGLSEALNYIEVSSVGSELSGLTRLKIGVHYELENVLAIRKNIYGQIERINLRYKEALEAGKLEERLKPSLEADIVFVKKQKQILIGLEDKVRVLEEEVRNTRPPTVKINSAIYPDFELRANGCFFELKEEHKGALTLILNRERECFDKFK